MPQCPDKEYWSSKSLKLLLDEVSSKYSVDTKRMYCTGLSMGGFGTWKLSMAFPDLFAAVIPICGGGNPNQVDKIKHLPAWIFHGEKDWIVPCTESEQMVQALRRIGAKEVKYTSYPTLEHDSWTVTYDNPDIYTWLLNHSK
eukprot:TRINITY_DN1724_c0_g1_i1.p1 TRINITY_DN1724_c0_g1~~TRINITY_DN1724_c0_g1_i1.p1  ORF type:complete len:142 (-),score=27.18 TRINITY_DN1724_c0_g1_i1:17-442(-)